MAPLKVWAPNERLTSADLNAAFAEVAANRMPGVYCDAGAVVSFAAGESKEISAGAPNPLSSWDPAGYWNSSTSRLVVPAGLAGIHILSGSVAVSGTGAKGDIAQIWFLGGGTGSAYQQFPRLATGPGGATLTVIPYLAAGAAVYLMAMAEAAISLQVTELTMIRLAGLGMY